MGPNMKYLIDTNILIYYFNGSLSAPAKEKITAMLNDDFNISVISKMEFLGFSRFDFREKQEAVRFITFANVLPLSESIVERTIQLKQTAKITLPDAIIGATALCHNLNLVTHNVKDFVGIDLVLSDPCD
jgi:predicted nucleic acid-binding protein